MEGRDSQTEGDRERLRKGGEGEERRLGRRDWERETKRVCGCACVCVCVRERE